MSAAAALSRERNAATRDCWEEFSEHRERLTALVEAACPPGGGSLCVLGAGNGNDLDYARLAERFRELHLVDADEAALERAAARHGGAPLRLHPGVELSEGDAVWAGWRPEQAGNPLAALRLTEALEAAPGPVLPGPFAVTVSACLLTPLIEAAAVWTGGKQPLTAAVAAAVRRRHARLLMDWTAPGGSVVLACDCVSSETFPELPGLEGVKLAESLSKQLAQGNFFCGTHPAAVREDLARAAALAGGAEQAVVTPAWRWRLKRRWFAVYGVTVKRAD